MSLAALAPLPAAPRVDPDAAAPGAERVLGALGAYVAGPPLDPVPHGLVRPRASRRNTGHAAVLALVVAAGADARAPGRAQAAPFDAPPDAPANAQAGAQAGAPRTRVTYRGPLPTVAGGRLRATVVEVTYAPGGASLPHVHACPVVAYVARGAVRSRVASGAAAVYRAGESFVKAPGVAHVTSANASRTAPATLVATFVCDRDAPDPEGTRP